MPPQMLAVRQCLAPGYNDDVSGNAIWRWGGCAIALLAVSGCELLFQVAGEPRHDASAVAGDVEPPTDIGPDTPDTHDEDGDLVYDPDDNCPSDAQPGGAAGQVDTDGDHIGDVCDPSSTTQQSFQFFDPLLSVSPASWTTTIAAVVSGWSGDSSNDAVVSTSAPAFAERTITAGSGTAEVWVGDPPANVVTGLVWGVLFPADSSNPPSSGTSAGCVLLRYPDGSDHVAVSTGFTSIDAGVLAGITNTGPIRIVASLDVSSTTISCSVSRLKNPPTNTAAPFSSGGGHLAIFASDPGLTFNSVLYMTSP